jgi:hypothetical protein
MGLLFQDLDVGDDLGEFPVVQGDGRHYRRIALG